MRRTIIIWYVLCLVLALPCATTAQDSSGIKSKKSSSSKIRKAGENLKKALSADDELQTAREYETLANEFINKEDYGKAEETLNKAKDIYNRLKLENEAANVLRSLGKVQELQKKIKPAIESYEFAAQRSKDSGLERANQNDAIRLRTTSPREQQNLAEENITIFFKKGEDKEISNAYKQVAESQIRQNNTADALTNYKKAIEISPNSKEVAALSNKMADVYVSNNQVKEAIALAENVLAENRKTNDVEQQIDQLQVLSKLYQQYNNHSKALLLLQEAYNLAVSSGNTLKARNSALLLGELYKSQNRNEEAVKAYQVLLNSLDAIIKKDSSLVDSKIFDITEERIKELEQEKLLQNELIQRKNRFNYFLIGSIVLMIILIFFIVRALRAIGVKNKKIALQSLRREMNPHFIFNSLNSVNQYIAENNELEANKYLTSYSSLMRNVMENSGKDLVPLSVEIDQLKKYLALEHQRFRAKFDYTIKESKDIDAETTLVPNMLIQPHLENAIWHGLRYKDGKGTLLLEFQKKEKQIDIIIEDDGIGITKSKQLKTEHQKLHESRGVSNTLERISLLNDLYKVKISLQFEELSGPHLSGTRVTISVPLLNKNNAHFA